ncbi:MAG: nickel-dependent lactate racemase [bacterium]
MSDSVEIYYQGKREKIGLPSDWKLLGVGEPKQVAPIGDVVGELQKALASPVGMPSLSEVCSRAKSAAVIVDDQTRPTPAYLLLPELLAQMEKAGIPKDRISIVIGRGTHRIPDQDEIKAKVGEKIVQDYCIIMHDPDDKSCLVHLGQTRRGTPVWINKAVAGADFSIGIGNVVAHYLTGYSGGPKIVLPGVSGRETIVPNHTMAKMPEVRQGRTTGNPLHEDQMEVAKLAKLGMKIDLVLNMNNQIVKIVAGEVTGVHQGAIQAYNEIYGFNVPALADVTIASGYPLEGELLQSCKALLSSDIATKPGGTILLASQCKDGTGPGFYEALREKVEPSEIYQWIFEGKATPTGGPIAARVKQVMKSKKVVMVTDRIPPEKLEEMGMIYAPNFDEAIAKISSWAKQAQVLAFPAGSSSNPIV